MRLPTVIACRCSPTQKAELAQLIRTHTRARVAAVGDGGNDVAMIQAADAGVGLAGKEGRQASLAADVALARFCQLPPLLLWHGRNSYKRSAKLAQFVMHRGLAFSACQTLFSVTMTTRAALAGPPQQGQQQGQQQQQQQRFAPEPLFRDWLLVGYATLYTMAPVFSLVLDRDVRDARVARLYPELYKELRGGRALSRRTFAGWLLVSVYQGGVIQALAQLLVGVGMGGGGGGGGGNGGGALQHKRMVALSFSVLVLNELVMVACAVTTWHPAMLAALAGTAAVYVASLPLLGRYFDLAFVASLAFAWRALAIAAVALAPPFALKLARRTWRPPSYRKVQAV